MPAMPSATSTVQDHEALGGRYRKYAVPRTTDDTATPR
jgi:hypothetical protein